MAPEKWWTAFEDPVLSEVIEEALQNNLSLAGDWEQYKAALAVLKSRRSFLWPEVEATAYSAISRPEPDFAGGENLQMGVSAAYELDLWGRIASGVQAEKFRSEAAFLDYQSAAMTLSAETGISWFQLVTTHKQLELAEQQLQTNQKIMRLIRNRFSSGQIRAVDILRQEQLLESTRNQKVFYETELALLQNELSVLLGIPPQNQPEFPTDSLPQLPPLPATGLPLELIRRRPDVQQAYALVMAADREMAAAIRAKFPRLSLNLSGQMRSNDYNNLFKDWAYTLAGNIVAPLFYGGRLNAEVERTEAVKNQRLFEYGQVVLTAFREVEDALIRELKQQERIQILQRQLELAQKTNGQLRIEFLNGISNYLDVLLSLDREQQLQRDLLEAQQVLLETRIELYRALAGGFETERTATLP
ncbi:efflux transporter outer membrane subunit [Salinimicrobium soli]|uniref:efflux transporter outer membrane subunit n=1 Tax=Salinimicrobium soli TaxID=1254399 RepID=UPI003AAB4660